MKSILLKLLKPRLRAHVIAFASVLTHLTIISQNSWLPLSTGVSHNNLWLPSVNAMTVWNNKLVVGGAFTSAGGNNTDNIATWDGSNWSTLSVGLNRLSNQDVGSCFSLAGGITALSVYQGNLIAAGEIYSSGLNTFVCVAKWNGNNWGGIVNKLTLSEQGTSAAPCIRTMTIYNNKLIVAGLFDSINNIKAKNIAQWNGVNWSPVGNNVIDQGVNISYKGVFALEVYNNELYVGGNFTSTLSSQTTNNIVKWNGTNWSSLANGISNCFPSSGNPCKYGSVNCLKVYNSELYVGNCNSGISKWNGNAWSAVGGGMNPVANNIYAMHVFNNKLIIAGQFFLVGSFGLGIDLGSIAAWDGTNWMTVGNSPDDVQFGISGESASIYSLITYNNSLYVGGSFDAALSNVNFIFLNNITRYAGTTIGIKENSLSQKVQVSPNPSTNKFTFEGLTDICSIEVTDLAGRIIYTGQLDESKNFINMQGINSGLYLYKLRNKQNQTQQGKLIIE
jgi:hypothetical protein